MQHKRDQRMGRLLEAGKGSVYMISHIAESAHRRASATILALLAGAAVLAGALLIAPDQALAAEETRTFTWANGAQQPDIPMTVTGADGRVYTLSSQTQPRQLGQPQTTTQRFTRSESKRISPDQIGRVGSIMPSKVSISENGYSGTIPRTGIDTTPVYRTDKETVTATQEAQGTSEQAAKDALPKTLVRSGRTLTLASSVVEEADRDSAGNVTMYKAIGTYTGEIEHKVLDHYDATARYSGTLSKTSNTGDWTLTATYTADDAAAPAEGDGDQSADGENPDGEQPAEGEQDQAGEGESPENPDEINMMPAEDMDGNVIDPEDEGAADGDDQASDESLYDDNGDDEDAGIPILPIAVSVAAVALLAGGAIAFMRKKGIAPFGAPKGGADGADGLSDGDGYPDGDGLSDGTGYGAAAYGAAMAPVIIEDPQCQLIELVITEHIDEETGLADTEYEQVPKADLEIEPSCLEGIPTIIYFPSMQGDDGEMIEFVPVDGAEYWVAIDDETGDAVPDKRVIVASDDGYEIYRGELYDDDGEPTTQFKLDVQHMCDILNGLITEQEAKAFDISEELDGYADQADEALSQTEAVAQGMLDGDEHGYLDVDVDMDGFTDRESAAYESFREELEGMGNLSDDELEAIGLGERDDYDEPVPEVLEEADVQAPDTEPEDDEFANMLREIGITPEGDMIEEVAVAEESIGTFDDAPDDGTVDDNDADAVDGDGGDPFAAYGLADGDDGDGFDSEFEREMDAGIVYDPDLDPDVDEFEFPEDFQGGVVPERK